MKRKLVDTDIEAQSVAVQANKVRVHDPLAEVAGNGDGGEPAMCPLPPQHRDIRKRKAILAHDGGRKRLRARAGLRRAAKRRAGEAHAAQAEAAPAATEAVQGPAVPQQQAEVEQQPLSKAVKRMRLV